MFNPQMSIEAFIRQYEFWCSSLGLQEEDKIASGFVFCFENILKPTIMAAYESTLTWAAMKQTCIREIRVIYDVVDFDDAEAKFAAHSTYHNYNESLGIFKQRFTQHLAEYEAARLAEGLSRWTERERVTALCRRLQPVLRDECFKKMHTIHLTDDVWTVCRNFLRYQSLRRQSALRASALPEDPHAKALRLYDPQTRQLVQYYGPGDNKHSAAGSDGAWLAPVQSVGQTQRSLTGSDQMQHDQLFPLNPARATSYGKPGQIETTSKVMTKMWSEHEENMQEMLLKHYEKVKDEIRREMIESRLAEKAGEAKATRVEAKPLADRRDITGNLSDQCKPSLIHRALQSTTDNLFSPISSNPRTGFAWSKLRGSKGAYGATPGTTTRCVV